MKRKRSNSCSGSVSSVSDSGLSVSENSSGTSSPLAIAADIQVCDDDEEPHHQQTAASILQMQQQHSGFVHLPPGMHQPHPHDAAAMMHFREMHQQQSWMGLAFSYFNARNPYPQMYQPHHQFHEMRSIPAGFPHPAAQFLDSPPASHHHQLRSDLPRTTSSLHSPTSSVQSGRSDSRSPASVECQSPPASSNLAQPAAKKCSFSISAILGDR